MPFYLPIAFKNIFRDKRRSFTLGVNYFFIALLLFLVFSVTQGVKKNISQNVISSAAGHITISGEYIVKGRTFQGIADYPRVDSVVRACFPEARIAHRYTLNSSVYYKDLSKRLSFVGIDTVSDRGIRSQISLKEKDSWDQFAVQPNAVLMPRSIAEYFTVNNQDELLVSTRSRFGAFNTGTIQIRGLFTTGNYFVRDYVIAHFDFIRSLDLADTTTASKLYLFFENTRNLDRKREVLIGALQQAGFVPGKPASNNDALNAVSAASPRYTVLDENVNQIRLTLATVDEVTGIVSQVLAAVNGAGLFIAAIMLFIIAVSIFINMRMTINSRMQEIGTLRALGLERGQVTGLFIAENIFLSLVFICAGIAAGFLTVFAFSSFITLPAEGTLGLFLDENHFVFEPTVAAITFIIAALVLLTGLFSYFPARLGGRISPVVALNKVT